MTDTTIQNSGRSPLLKCAMDTMEGVFLAFTTEGKILEWNSRLKEVTGYSGDEIKKMPSTDLIGEEAGQIEERLEGASVEGASKEGRTRFVSYLKAKNGRSPPYRFTASLLRINGGKLI